MSLWADRVLPHLVEKACRSAAILDERKRWVPRAYGNVLELGVGSGFNLAFYDGSKVSKVTGIDPSVALLARAASRVPRRRARVRRARARARCCDPAVAAVAHAGVAARWRWLPPRSRHRRDPSRCGVPLRRPARRLRRGCALVELHVRRYRATPVTGYPGDVDREPRWIRNGSRRSGRTVPTDDGSHRMCEPRALPFVSIRAVSTSGAHVCELLAISARFPTTIHLSLAVLARHGGDADPHRDGWGVAYLQDGDALVLREPDAASTSALLACAKHTVLRSSTVIAHIRRATQGPRMLRNTQPFARELGGRQHVFAHNGMLPGIEDDARFSARRFRRIGDTDSEHAFCALLDRIAPLWEHGEACTIQRGSPDIRQVKCSRTTRGGCATSTRSSRALACAA